MGIHNLVDLCRLLNDRGIHYAVAGAHACALHGHVRATQDYDVLVKTDEENLGRVIEVIRLLVPENTDPLTIAELRESVVLKAIGEIEVDFMLQAWSVSYARAESTLCFKDIEGVRIPFLGLESLIESKSTAREIDHWDVQNLREKQKGGASA